LRPRKPMKAGDVNDPSVWLQRGRGFEAAETDYERITSDGRTRASTRPRL